MQKQQVDRSLIRELRIFKRNYKKTIFFHKLTYGYSSFQIKIQNPTKKKIHISTSKTANYQFLLRKFKGNFETEGKLPPFHYTWGSVREP